jgi:UDPglucose--hexose-1-phosphate uridylyltransferase
MAKYVPDVKTQRWVVISPARTTRPDDGKPMSEAPGSHLGGSVCPFCAGNEALTPPEVYRIGSGEKDKPGWLVRVVPNKFPITDIHEVFIHSTSHTDNVERLPLDHVAKILSCYRDRYRAHVNDGQVLIFCNSGLHAGASLAHPHSQLVVVPKQITLDSLSREPINNVIENNTHFVTYCPDFSQWPYEVWIAPKEEGHKYDDIKDNELTDLASVFQRALKKIEAVYKRSPIKPKDRGDQFVYNYYISHSNNWFIRIVPRFIHRAGFELGTGLNVNIVDSSIAAKELKEI